MVDKKTEKQNAIDHDLLVRIDERMRIMVEQMAKMSKEHLSKIEFEPFKAGFIHRNEFNLEIETARTARQEIKNDTLETQKRIRNLMWLVTAAVVVEIILKFFK